MVDRGMFTELDELRLEVDHVFRNAGYIHPQEADFLALTRTRRFPHSTFSEHERIINMSSYA